MYVSSSFAVSPLASVAPHRAGGAVGVPVPGHRNRSFARVSDQIEYALSDAESQTIEAYHIRNEAARGKAEGVPNPGTFILDREGVIRAKLFLEGYRDRHTTEALVEAAKAVK